MFRNKNKALTITIEEPSEPESEEMIQKKNIDIELEKIKASTSPSFPSMSLVQENERKVLLSKNNSYLNQLLTYMESENYINDISFKHISENSYLKSVSDCIFINEENSSLLNRNLQSEFQLLKYITEDNLHKSTQVDLAKNLKRSNNRYSDMLPYKYNLVPFQETQHHNSTNQHEWYINASYVNGPFKSDEKCFIATQGPLASTMGKFYKMCFNKNIKLVIMLCSFEEEGRKKCERYLPSQTNIEKVYEDGIKVVMLKEEWLVRDCLIKREINITFHDITKNITHLQMVNWPDYSMPNEITGDETITYLIKTIAECREIWPESPVLLHCSAGTGRTGTLIAIFNLVKCLFFFNSVNYDREVKPFFSVFNMVRRLREQRPGMVSSLEQYRYIYQFILNWIKRNIDTAR